jgi:hypothetical protein
VVLMLRSLLIGYLVVWAVLLIACIRRQEFCTVFSNSRRTRLFWLATFVFFNPLLTILYLVLGQLRSPQARPVRITRDVVMVIAILGFLVNIPGLTHLWMQPFLGRSASAGEHFSAHLATIRSGTNTSTASSVSGVENSRLACRRVAVIVEGNHPLLHRVGSELVDRLKTVAGIEAVDIYTDGAFPPGQQRRPDIFVQVCLDKVSENCLPYSLKLDAQVRATVSPMPLRSRSSTRDNRTPPSLDFNMTIELDHSSQTEGYESARYTLAAKDIAKDLGKAITSAFDQWRKKYSLLPDLPADFYGAYQANGLPQPVGSLHPHLLGSYCGLLKHNETFMEFEVAAEPVKAMETLRDQMKELGWTVPSDDLTGDLIDIRLSKDNRRIHIFKIEPEGRFTGWHKSSSPSDPVTPTCFGVHDVELMSDDEVNGALDRLFASPAPVEQLMLFQQMLSREQHDRLVTALETRPTRDVGTQIWLAEAYGQSGRTEQSKQALIRARTLLWLVQDDTDYRTRLKTLAKKLGDEKLAEARPTGQDFRDAGFAEIVVGGDPCEVEARLGEPAVAFWDDGRSEPHILCLTVAASGDDKDPFFVKYLHRMSSGSGYGSQGGFVQRDRLWQCSSQTGYNDLTIKWQVVQTPDRNRFRLSFTVSK